MKVYTIKASTQNKNDMTEQIMYAFGLTLFAGLATGIGSLISFFSKKPSAKFLAGSLGFSAGVMIYVSLVEIFFKAKISLTHAFGNKMGYFYTVCAFFAGIAIVAFIDKMIPSFENPHEIENTDEKIIEKKLREHKKILRMGLFSALAIAIHNFPEGLVTFMGALADPHLGFGLAIAVAIHNIPEGIAISVPIHYATKNKKKAFLFSFLSGLAEPVGAFVGYFLLRNFLNDTVFGIIFAGVAGIMIYISLDELLPTAEKYGEHHIAIGGLVAGMAIMAMSLVILA